MTLLESHQRTLRGNMSSVAAWGVGLVGSTAAFGWRVARAWIMFMQLHLDGSRTMHLNPWFGIDILNHSPKSS